MRRLLTILTLTVLLLGPLLARAPGTADAGVAARCHLLATVDGKVLTIDYHLIRGGPHKDWRVKFFRDGDLAYQHVHRTDGDGRFRVVRDFVNHPGRETIVATAKRLDTGAICRVSVIV